MKIIELLNKIANGEEKPKKVKFDNQVFEYRKDMLDYYCYDYDLNLMDYQKNLNEEVEIIEEEKKIPEKLKWNEKSQHNVVTDNTKKTLEHLLSRSEQLKKSINDIIDYLKSKGE